MNFIGFVMSNIYNRRGGDAVETIEIPKKAIKGDEEAFLAIGETKMNNLPR